MSTAVPVATYRLQFNASFTFDAAAAIVDYLDALGISHCYASSYFKAVPGSTHGYDVADPTMFNPEIGDEESYRRWIAALRAHGMGHIVDLVPNHMGIAGSANPWWQDVLENGPSSRFASVFDIDWHPLKPELENKVLLPFLGRPYGTALEEQEIQLRYQDGAFSARYFETTLPIAPGTYDRILRHDSNNLLSDLGPEADEGLEFQSILTAIQNLPGRDERDPARLAERDREKESIKRRLATLTRHAPRLLEHIDRAVVHFNGVAGDAASFDALDDLLSAQPYRLAYWRVAAEEINYRRFFDINELAAIRMEDPAVFDLTHGFAFDLLKQGYVDGFRIDHVDGLYDPGDYLRRMQARAREVAPERFGDRPMFLVVEKILGVDETMPDWPVDGTTGYEFLVRINGLSVDRRHERVIDDIYDRFSRVKVPFPELAYRGKGLILRMSMASELNVLAGQLNRFSERNRHYRDFTLNILTVAIREIIASFSVYRTYVNEHDEVSPRDRNHIDEAVNAAKRRNPRRPNVVFDFVRDLLLKRADYIPIGERDAHMRFLGKFQQATSPVAAKGIEDTALYIYNRLVSLNEVGGEPGRFGEEPEELHRWLQHRAERWGHGLSATATHDTKRGEDVRARINVLSELPVLWREATTRWARMNRRGRTMIEGASYPSRNEEYLLYQTLIGTWPVEPMSPAIEAEYRGRIANYMLKAMREAKVFTSWLNPSEAHETAMVRFVESVLSVDHTAFRADFVPLAHRVARCGAFNSLAQLTLKITAPGIPDFYQGTELWDFNLVDPDNRRPVDYGRRMTLLRDIAAARQDRDLTDVAADLLDQQGDALKLFVAATLLHTRRDRRELFETGSYQGLTTEGMRRDHLFAFCRRTDQSTAVVAVPRLVASLMHDSDAAPVGERTWGDTSVRLPAPAPPDLIHRLTGRCIPVCSDARGAYVRAADMFEHFPIACLEAR